MASTCCSLVSAASTCVAILDRPGRGANHRPVLGAPEPPDGLAHRRPVDAHGQVASLRQFRQCHCPSVPRPGWRSTRNPLTDSRGVLVAGPVEPAPCHGKFCLLFGCVPACSKFLEDYRYNVPVDLPGNSFSPRCLGADRRPHSSPAICPNPYITFTRGRWDTVALLFIAPGAQLRALRRWIRAGNGELGRQRAGRCGGGQCESASVCSTMLARRMHPVGTVAWLTAEPTTGIADYLRLPDGLARDRVRPHGVMAEVLKLKLRPSPIVRPSLPSGGSATASRGVWPDPDPRRSATPGCGLLHPT